MIKNEVQVLLRTSRSGTVARVYVAQWSHVACEHLLFIARLVEYELHGMKALFHRSAYLF